MPDTPKTIEPPDDLQILLTDLGADARLSQAEPDREANFLR